jgi:hypothetical protein
MLTKNDLVLILTEMEEQGVVVTNQLRKVVTAIDIPIDVLKFVNDNRQMDVASFYERLRKNYNNKRSDLYKNIVKEVEDPQEVLTTLSAYALQVLLYSKHVDNVQMFFKHSRVEEVTRVLNNYYKTYDVTSAMKLLKLIKVDLKAFESIK